MQLKGLTVQNAFGGLGMNMKYHRVMKIQIY